MIIYNANLAASTLLCLNDVLYNVFDFGTANKKLCDLSGIVDFFENQSEFETLLQAIKSPSNFLEATDRTEYGDFQTNINLATSVCRYLDANHCQPEIIIEPTCGKGNFIIAALSTFKNAQKIFGIEIYKPYCWETKFNILEYFIKNPTDQKPEIKIINHNVFDFDFKTLHDNDKEKQLLIIGNPPWVTNAQLGSLGSENLPDKSNFKNHNGLDAVTGKGNFDIGEYISMMLFDTFQNSIGNMAFLVKNAVIKNIIFEQKQKKYKLGNILKLSIDSKKEFNVSVEASLFYCNLNNAPSFYCQGSDFYKTGTNATSFGWVGDKFVSNIDNYQKNNYLDNICPLVWRQGIKHDCSSIMEFEKNGDGYKNGDGNHIDLEDNLVYNFLKSSDLKATIINKSRKHTIVTQTKVGQETNYIKDSYPKTYTYLMRHKSTFDDRKSIIYKGKPSFSIFGVGDYSFKKYKVAISGLYKTYSFCLVMPINGKPVMLDDTCYFLGFDNLEFAAYTLILLNSETTKHFLQSITFPDAKRMFTKDVLMRIDILKLALVISDSEIKEQIDNINTKYDLGIKKDCWDRFIGFLNPIL